MGTVAIVCISLTVGGVVGFLIGRRAAGPAPDPQRAGADAIVDLLRLVNEHLPREADAVGSLARIMYPTTIDYIQARLHEHPTRPDPAARPDDPARPDG